MLFRGLENASPSEGLKGLCLFSTCPPRAPHIIFNSQVLTMIHIIKALFIFPFVLGSLAVPLAKRTVVQVETDITEPSNRVTALRSAVQAFPSSGGSLASALVGFTR